MTLSPQTPPPALRHADEDESAWHIAALYHFAPIPAPEAKLPPLKALCRKHGIKGTLLLAPEGINGTIAAPNKAALQTVLAHIGAWEEITTPMEIKHSRAREAGFMRLKIRLKREIVTMGRPEIMGEAVSSGRGDYVEPRDWNALISREDVLVVDTRNTYETRIGQFAGAVCPGTTAFGEFPGWAENLRKDPSAATKKIAMYCTGGIRCEKASAYMKSLGFGEVYHLKGGILKYLEEIPPEASLWQGECFVFDERVSLRHGVELGGYTLCHACKEPLSEADRASPDYEQGVACPHCADKYTATQRERFRNRQRQITLAKSRGRAHMGEDAMPEGKK